MLWMCTIIRNTPLDYRPAEVRRPYIRCTIVTNILKFTKLRQVFVAELAKLWCHPARHSHTYPTARVVWQRRPDQGRRSGEQRTSTQV